VANLRVFLSSTCYDLSVVRGQLRQFIEGLGHEPVMSDYNDVVYDPRTHTHTSCIDEVAGADAVVVIIGSRFGGKVTPQALAKVDLEALKSISKSSELLKSKEFISITQLEVLKAIESSIPVFAFVDDRVMHDHATYEKNKSKVIADQIEYDSIEKPETARYIFEFINFLRLRSTNNGITTFGRLQDIEDALKKQWSGLLQRLLFEHRSRAIDSRRIDSLTDQFEVLKTAILTAVGGSKDQKEIARGVVQYRKLVDFIRAFPPGASVLTEQHVSWTQFLSLLTVTEIVAIPRDMFPLYRNVMRRPTHFMIREDKTFYELYSIFDIEDMESQWDRFMAFSKDTRKIIVEALEELGQSSLRRYVRHIKKPIEQYVQERLSSRETADEEDGEGPRT
jgi:hypothetical protein